MLKFIEFVQTEHCLQVQMRTLLDFIQKKSQ